MDSQVAYEEIGLLHVMGGKEYRHPLAIQVFQVAPDDATTSRVEAVRRLV